MYVRVRARVCACGVSVYVWCVTKSGLRWCRKVREGLLCDTPRWESTRRGIAAAARRSRTHALFAPLPQPPPLATSSAARALGPAAAGALRREHRQRAVDGCVVHLPLVVALPHRRAAERLLVEFVVAIAVAVELARGAASRASRS